MLKKTIVTLFICFGVFQLFDVNYRLNHEGMGLLSDTEKVQIVAPIQVNSSSTSSSLAVKDPVSECKSKGFALNYTFSNLVTARLPSLLLSAISPNTDSLFYFSEVVSLNAEAVEFKWFLRNELVHQETVVVGGSRWRVWSKVDGLSKNPSPVTVELWIGKCLIHQDHIDLESQEKSIPLNSAVDFFSYYKEGVFSELYRALQYASLPAEPALVYIFDYERLRPKIYVEIESKFRDVNTRDVFTKFVLEDKSLPLSTKKGNGAVMNYSDTNINRKTMNGDTVLLEAIKNNSQNTIKSLLAIGANPFIRDSEGKSPLDLALALKDKALVDMLLEYMIHGSSVEASTWSYAQKDGNYYLGTHRKNYQMRNRLGETALMRAAASGDEYAIITLTGLNTPEKKKEKADLPYVDLYDFDYAGYQAVDIAKDFGYEGAVLLLEKAMEKFSPSWAVFNMKFASELQDNLPVNCSIQPGKRIWFVATLMDVPLKMAKVVWSTRSNYQDPWREIKTQEYLITNTEYSLLSYVDPIDIGDKSTEKVKVEILLNEQRVPSSWIEGSYSGKGGKSCDYWMSIQEASLKQQFTGWVAAKTLRKRAEGVSIDKLVVHDELLYDALNYESLTILQLLFEEGLDSDNENRRDDLLGKAVFKKKLALTQYLLAHGASLDQKNDSRRRNARNLMDMAIYNRDIQMVKFLVYQGFSVNEIDGGIEQPLVEALDECHAEMVGVLLALGADPDLPVKSESGLENTTIREYSRRCDYEPKVGQVLSSYTAGRNHARQQ